MPKFSNIPGGGIREVIDGLVIDENDKVVRGRPEPNSPIRFSTEIACCADCPPLYKVRCNNGDVCPRD